MTKLVSILFLLSFALASVCAQDLQVKGTVISGVDKEPLPGVNVAMKGNPTIGTITGLDGDFTLSVPLDATLSISYIGFKSRDVAVNGQKNLEIVLVEDSEALGEVVVIGYGVQKKSVVTAAISRVSADELNTGQPSRVEDALKGKASGVQITQSSGQPGSDSKVRIRGIGTVNSSDPLYIVDGMPVDGGINYLNPVDVESIEVLKDAASAAIYGARAANGVILVTTKSGKIGKTSINYNFSYGWQNPWRKKAVLDATDYMTIMNEIEVNDGNAARYTQEQIAKAGKGTDWQDETFNRNAPVQQHQVSMNGGNDKMQYFLSLGYFNQEGVIGGNYDKSNYERWSLRSNSAYTVFEDTSRKFLNKLKVGVNIGYSRSISSSIEIAAQYGSILSSTVLSSPLVPVYASKEEAAAILKQHPTAVTDKYGNVFALSPAGFQEVANPVAELNSPTAGKNNEDKFVGSFFAELDILAGLKLKSSYGADLAFWGYDGYGFEYYLSSMKKNEKSWVQSEMNRSYRWQVENVLTYKETFAEKHNMAVVLGQSAQKYSVRRLGGSDYNLLDRDPLKATINSAISDRNEERVWGGTDGFDFIALASYFGRVDYNFDERYMVQATIRRDGSSRFGPKHKWAVFPAVSVGWNVWNEPCLLNLKPSWFDALKLRFSWGRNGNENISNFRYAALMDGGQNYYFGGGYNVLSGSKDGFMQYGSSLSVLPNANIKWEESEQIDLGFDASFFDAKFNLGFDYFKKTTNDMLMNQPIPSYVGQSAPMSNLGKMENQGIELEARWRQTVNDFSYHISANASFLKNKLVNLGNASGETNYESDGPAGVGDYVHAKNGEVWPYFYGMKSDGLFQSQAEIDAYVNDKGQKMQPEARPGDVRFVDFNNDGKVNDDDRTKIGKGMPDWTFGVSLGADWKGFDLNLFFQGTVGNDIFDLAQRGYLSAANRPAWILDRWTGEGSSNSIPRMTSANPNKNWRSSDLYVKDASYLRLKTAQFGYTLPLALTRKFSVQRLRIYVSGENLLTFTGYDGFDPELAPGGYTTLGIDKGGYPQSRTISVGANIAF